MQGYRLCVNYVLMVGMLIVLFPNISKASNEQGETRVAGQKGVLTGVRQDGAVAVIPLHFGESTKKANEVSVEKLERWLEHEKVQVVDAAVLQSRLHARQVPLGDSKVVAEFKTIGAVVAQGTEDFYYKGNEAALEALKPVFDKGLLNMEVTARDPEYVEQVFQAGLMLIRAYSGVGNPLLASEIAGKLAAYFPGKEPSLTQVPPDVVALWRSEVEKIAAGGTSIFLEYSANDACEARIQGVSVGNKSVLVQVDMDYMVSLHCGSATAPLWRVRAKAGEKIQVPLVEGDMMIVSSGASDDKLRRREIEFRFKTFAYWTGVDTVLGFYEDAAGETVVRFDQPPEGDFSAMWIARDESSAGGEDASFDVMMLQAFPAVALARVEKAEADRLLAGAEPWISDWVTPVLFATGAAAAAVGGIFLYDASTQATVMNCSPNALVALTADQCKGVQEVNFSNSADYYDAWDKVHRARIIGYSSVGVGAALVGWGAWRLISGAGSSKPAAGTDIGLWGGSDSLGAIARWRF